MLGGKKIERRDRDREGWSGLYLCLCLTSLWTPACAEVYFVSLVIQAMSLSDFTLDARLRGHDGLNQTTGLWHTVAQVEKTQAVRSERRRASREACPELAEGLRPKGERIHC
jgi:hypothetical protein